MVAGLVLSFMAGISHTYYVVVLTPAIGALAGIGAAKLWEVRRSWLARATLAVTLLVTGGWAWVLLGRSAGWLPWLRVVIVIAGAGAAALILAGFAPRAGAGRGRAAVAVLTGAVPVCLALVAALAGPLAYSVDTAAGARGGASPAAGPALLAGARGLAGGGAFPGGGLPGGGGLGRDFGGFADFPRDRVPGFEGGAAAGDRERRAGNLGGAGRFGAAGARGGIGGLGGNAATSAALAKLLESGAPGYRWAAATVGSDSAASLELSTGGVPVMAIGGFSGSDPAPSLAEFQQLVAAPEVHYFVAGAGGGFGGAGGAGRGGGTDASQVTVWVAAHFTAQTVGGTTVYNLTAPVTAS